MTLTGTFTGLSNLTSLDLCCNKITKLEFGTFDELTSLTYLSLSSNQISDFEPGTFNELSSLTGLSLSSNNLTTLSPLIFYGLDSLRYLSLYNNWLTRLSADVFKHLPRPLKLGLYYKYYYDQPKHPELLVCDSELCWLKQEEQRGTITWNHWFGTDFFPKCADGLDWGTWNCDETGDVVVFWILKCFF